MRSHAEASLGAMTAQEVLECGLAADFAEQCHRLLPQLPAASVPPVGSSGPHIAELPKVLLRFEAAGHNPAKMTAELQDFLASVRICGRFGAVRQQHGAANWPRCRASKDHHPWSSGRRPRLHATPDNARRSPRPGRVIRLLRALVFGWSPSGHPYQPGASSLQGRGEAPSASVNDSRRCKSSTMPTKWRRSGPGRAW
jgi:hypothetical protein